MARSATRLPTRSQTPGKPGAVQGFEIGADVLDAAERSACGSWAMIMEKYGELGWENGWLGFPMTNEVPVKDGGRFTEFQDGNIYWSPGTGAWSVQNGPIFDALEERGLRERPARIPDQ